jgi:hypothetical protein
MKTAMKSALDFFPDDLPIQRVDYDALGAECGEIAYERAKNADLPAEVVQEFRKVFGKPIDPDLRFS